MSHAVETMAFAHEVPWHGLGNNIDPAASIDTWLEVSGLNWEVERIPVYTGDNKDPIPNHLAVRRATDKLVYDIVSPRWKPVQNREILEFFREWTEAGDATLETAGSLHNGKEVWALANLKTGFTLPGGDAVKAYVLLRGSHESGKATIARDTSIRVVCANTMAMAFDEAATKELRWSHAKEFDREAAKKAFGLSRDNAKNFEKATRTLAKMKLDMDKTLETLAPIFMPNVEADDIYDEANWGPTMDNIMWAINKAPGAVGLTGWGVLNGVTYALDHKAPTKTPDGKFYAAQFGHQAKNKEKTFKALMALAD